MESSSEDSAFSLMIQQSYMAVSISLYQQPSSPSPTQKCNPFMENPCVQISENQVKTGYSVYTEEEKRRVE